MKNLKPTEVSVMRKDNPYFDPIIEKDKDKLRSFNHYYAFQRYMLKQKNHMFFDYIDKYHQKEYCEAIQNRIINRFKFPGDIAKEQEKEYVSLTHKAYRKLLYFQSKSFFPIIQKLPKTLLKQWLQKKLVHVEKH